MSERVKIAAKTPEQKRGSSFSQNRNDMSKSVNSPVNQILFLQRTIGNQAVQGLFKSGVIQAKLKIGQPNDIYEQEADRVAEQVMRIPENTAISGQPSVVRKEDESVQTKPACVSGCPSCKEEELIQQKPLAITPLVQKQIEEETIQIKKVSDQSPEVTADIESSINALQGGGQLLPQSVRAFFEPRFGHDFSQVRVHTDANAWKLAQTVNAKAFTVGKDVVLGAGQYAPGTSKGQRLLSHELTHVVQQKTISLPIYIARFGPTCSGGTSDPCQVSRCPVGHTTTVPADIGRSIGYINGAISALNASPLTDTTMQTLDWFFRDHSTNTVDTVKERLNCILNSLNDTVTNNRYACHPDHSALAYVCVGSIPFCAHNQATVCLTDNYFSDSERGRAETLIHECGHREGLSVGSRPDIYDHSPRFMHLSTPQALGNADSYSLFASSIAAGVPLSVLLYFRLGAGAIMPVEGIPTWSARLDIDTEFQHPVLSMFNPTIGIHMSLIGSPEPTAGSGPIMPGTSPTPTALFSLVGGVRIGEPRAGAGGAGYVSFFGGPALDIGPGRVEVGAEAGMAVGFRWRFLDVSAGAGYLYAPTRPAGLEHMFQVGGTIGFTLGIFNR